MKERYVLRADILLKEREYGGLLVNPRLNEKTYLNETAFCVLSSVDGEHTLKEIVDHLSEEWHVSPDELACDITEMMEDFKRTGILQKDGKRTVPPYAGSILDKATIEVTRRCNLRCNHCIIGASPTNGKDLDRDTLYDIVDQLAEMQVLDLTLTGGEPFLRSDFCDILRHAQERMLCTVLTNGTCITEKETKILQEINPKLIQVSLDGATRETHDAIRGEGTFEKTVQAIRNLVEADLPVEIATVFSKFNFHEYPLMIDFAKHLGVDALDVSELLPQGRGRALHEYCLSLKENCELKKYYYEKTLTETEIGIGGGQSLDFLKNPFDSEKRSPRRDLCYAFETSLVIKADGVVIPCLSLDEEEFHMGTILEQSVADIWNSPPYERLRMLSVDDCQECSSCVYVRICGGSCRAKVYQISGDLRGPPDQVDCESRKAVYQFGLNKWKPGTTIEEFYQLIDGVVNDDSKTEST